MYPLDNWKSLQRGYRFGDKTFYNDFHLGLDLIVPTGTNLYMPFDGIVNKSTGKQGGLTATVHIPGYTIRFMHLLTIRQIGHVPVGAVFAETDNTGLSTGPHCHLDISKGDTVIITDHTNFIDPDLFDWGRKEWMTEDEFREVVDNVVNGFYLTYYMRLAGTFEVEKQAHVDAIMAFTPRKYAISDWVNKQANEAEFKQKWHGQDDAWKVQTIQKLKEVVTSLGG